MCWGGREFVTGIYVAIKDLITHSLVRRAQLHSLAGTHHTPTTDTMQSVLIATLIGAASAFQIAPLAAMRRAPIVVTMGLAEEAANCLEEGCSIDAVADLVSDLKNECVVLNQNGLAGSSRNQQARPLRASHRPSTPLPVAPVFERFPVHRLRAQVLTLISQLEVLNVNPEANKSEIEKIISGASRSFSVVEAFPFPGEPVSARTHPPTALDSLIFFSSLTRKRMPASLDPRPRSWATPVPSAPPPPRASPSSRLVDKEGRPAARPPQAPSRARPARASSSVREL